MSFYTILKNKMSRRSGIRIVRVEGKHDDHLTTTTTAYFELTLENLTLCWANCYCCKWPNIEQIIQPSGHTIGHFRSYLHTTERSCIVL